MEEGLEKHRADSLAEKLPILEEACAHAENEKAQPKIYIFLA
jgi:hypothetical protein